MRLTRILILLISLSMLTNAIAQPSVRWVDSIMSRMSVQEKIGQLFLLPVSAARLSVELPPAETFSRNFLPGGIVLTDGTPAQGVRVIRHLQGIARVPLFAGLDIDHGSTQYLQGTVSAMVAGASASDSLIKESGRSIGRQMRTLGFQLALGPNVDLDVPGAGSTVAYRYFSDDKETLYNKAASLIDGIQAEGGIAIIKHLPGPSEEERSAAFLSALPGMAPDTLSFLPVSRLLAAGAGGINTAYLHVGFRKNNNKALPAAAAQLFLNDHLRIKTGYQGLLVTDGAFFSAITGKRRGEMEKFAFQLGYDLIIGPAQPERAIRKIARLVKRDKRQLDRLNVTVARILTAKFKAGLAAPVNPQSEISNRERYHAQALQAAMAASAITVLKNDLQVLPVRTLDNRKFHLLDFGGFSRVLETMLNRYVPFETHRIKNIKDVPSLTRFAEHDVVVAAISDASGMDLTSIGSVLKSFSPAQDLIVLHTGNPANLGNLASFHTIIEGYHVQDTERYLPQVLFGGLPADGTTPVRLTGLSLHSQDVPDIGRLAVTEPEQVQMEQTVLDSIDLIAEEAIRSGATPGCRVLIARKGQVVFDRSYGWHNYERTIPVSETSIYDLASVTKVTATLQTTMFLEERGLIDIHKKASVYLPELAASNKKDFTLKDILTHQSGLIPFIPFWTRTMRDTTLLPAYYSRQRSDRYPHQVSENLFIRQSMPDSLWHWIIRARISDKKDRVPFDYKYSDMGFYILRMLGERLLNQPMDEFLSHNLYEPIGASSLGYHPLNRFPSSRIAPTEQDKGFRKSLLTGYVHDQGAALHGGIAGHAGLFGTALDMAKMGQLWLQKGQYGGHRYFSPETIELFTARQFPNSRRGLGWDKPPMDGTSNPAGDLASPLTFGHTGFTGTCIWVDPFYDLVYVFLSNRVHPDMNNNKLI
ncbi:MAG: serine hydrolase, partial [Bacteroidota bacterium]